MPAPPPFPTRSLSDREFHEDVITVSHSVRADYLWDAGEAIGRYLDGLRAGRIMGRECRECGRVLVPPRMFCEQCFRPTDRWVEVPATGTVNTFSVCWVTWDMHKLTVPELPAVIDLESGGIMHKLGDVEPDAVHIGMRVEAVWKPPAQRQGSILDIAHWAPLKAPDTREKAPLKAPDTAKNRQVWAMFDKPAHPDAVRLWPGSIPISHRYTAGLAGERFFRVLAERGAFLATRCDRCSVVYCPPVAFCERCLQALADEREVGPSATLASFTVVRVGLDGQPLDEPQVVGLIRMDGADTCLVHRVAGDPATLSVGMALEPVLRQAGARTGSLDDVEHFRAL